MMNFLARCLMLFILCVPLAKAWPPERNGVVPDVGFQQRFDELMWRIDERMSEFVEDIAASADASAVSSQGTFVLNRADFSALERAPVLNKAGLWSVADQAFSSEIQLEFATYDIAANPPELAQLDKTLKQWLEQLQRWRSKMDSTTATRLNDFYIKFRRYLRADSFFASAGKPQISVAYYTLDGERIPLAMSVTSFNERLHNASFDYIASQPLAQLPREVRPQGTPGAVGQPLMDYEFRRLSQLDEVSFIRVYAENNRVSSFALKRGFHSGCE